MLAAAEAGVPIYEYTPAEVKRVVVGYGRAEKPQVQQMIKMMLNLAEPPSPHDAADALAVAVCHIHSQPPPRSAQAIAAATAARPRRAATSWRHYRP
jgi:crossover junction endodeoxyribonuclease RuvC